MSIERPEMLAAVEHHQPPRHLAFVGRDAELAALEESTARAGCVSVFGPPGVGKSRLLAEFVRRRRARGESWVVCDVGRCRAASELVGVLSDRLQIEARLDQPLHAELDRLATICADQGARGVVLDGFDHLFDERAILSSWQQKLPDLCILVSSRARLPAAQARGFRLEPLSVAEATTLFEARAQQARQGFRVDETSRDAVAEIVRRLDCLPVAVELAAARANILDPHSLLDRLSRRFDLLRSASAAAPVEALEDTIAWSWELLDEPHRRCLQACTAFAAAFTLEAAEAVVGRDVSSHSAMNLLDDLVAAAWLQVIPARGPGQTLQFSMLESLREFARRRTLADDAARESIRARFVAYYVELAERLADQLERAPAVETLERLEASRDNLMRAVEYALDADPRAACRMLWAMRRFFLVRGAPESLAAIERAADWADEADHSTYLARMLCMLGELAFARGRSRLASESLSRAYAIARQGKDDQCGDRLRAIVARASSIPLAQLDVESAAERLEDAARAAQRLADPLLEARVYERQGFVHLQIFRLADAERFFERARDESVRAGAELFSAGIVTGLAYVARRRGNHDGALMAFEEAVSLQEEYAGPASRAGARFNLAVALHGMGRLERADGELERAATLWGELGLRDLLPLAQTLSGAIAHEAGDAARANTELRRAIAAARRAGDAHNRALAEGWWALTRTTPDFSSGPIGLLEDCTNAIDPVRAPDAAAAFLAALAALYAARGEQEQAARAEQRLAGMASWLSDEDAYLREVLDVIESIARFYAHRDTTARALLARLLGEGDFRDAVARWPNPFVRDLLRRLDALEETAPAAEPPIDEASSYEHLLTIHRHGHWFQVDDAEPVDLLTRRAMRRIMDCLVEHHLDAPHTGVPVEELIERGWPDEVLLAEAGKTRVYSAIRMLRDMGLRGIIVTDDAGYHFAHEVGVRPTEKASPA